MVWLRLLRYSSQQSWAPLRRVRALQWSVLAEHHHAGSHDHYTVAASLGCYPNQPHTQNLSVALEAGSALVCSHESVLAAAAAAGGRRVGAGLLGCAARVAPARQRARFPTRQGAGRARQLPAAGQPGAPGWAELGF